MQRDGPEERWPPGPFEVGKVGTGQGERGSQGIEYRKPLVRQFVMSITQQLCDESCLGCNQEFGPAYMPSAVRMM